jgi:hypothetical protein
VQLYKENFYPSFSLKYFFIVSIYFGLSLFGILHHWLLARDSNSLQELFYNSRCDGHPLLWNTLLMFITRFSHDPFYMQLLHITISTIGVIIFLRNAPFTDLFKIFFVFGYYMLYEYNIISRNYAISMLMLFIFCTLYKSTTQNPLRLFIVLAVLANTHVFSLIAATGLAGFTAADYFKSKNANTAVNKKMFFLGLTVFILAVIASILQIIPPPDHFLFSYNSDPYLSFKRIGKALSVVFKGFVNLQNFTDYHFWNTNIFIESSKKISAIISLIFLLIPFLVLKNKKQPLLFFYFTTIGIIGFIYFSPLFVAVRHCGFIFIAFIIALWLSAYAEKNDFWFSNKKYRRIFYFTDRYSSHFVYAVLIIQLVSSGIAYSLDIMLPFSEGKTVVLYLKENKLSDKTIAIDNQGAGPPVSSYLDKKVFYPATGEYGSFCKWNIIPSALDQTTLFSRIEKIKENDFILVLNEPLFHLTSKISGTQVFANEKMTIFYLAEFDKGIVRNENYWVYDLKRKPF